MIPMNEIVFYVFAAALVVSSFFVILQKNPVQSVLSLIVCFIASAVLWMLLQAEFLSLVLIFVYVGAVMTLFLFVVMMLNVRQATHDSKYSRLLPLAGFVSLLFFLALFYCLTGKNLPAFLQHLPNFPADTNNTVNMGMQLYTVYLYPLEIAAVILLVAMLAAIAIALQGPRGNVKSQKARDQLSASKANRLRIVSMKQEKK